MDFGGGGGGAGGFDADLAMALLSRPKRNVSARSVRRVGPRKRGRACTSTGRGAAVTPAAMGGMGDDEDDMLQQAHDVDGAGSAIRWGRGWSIVRERVGAG